MPRQVIYHGYIWIPWPSMASKTKPWQSAFWSFWTCGSSSWPGTDISGIAASQLDTMHEDRSAEPRHFYSSLHSEPCKGGSWGIFDSSCALKFDNSLCHGFSFAGSGLAATLDLCWDEPICFSVLCSLCSSLQQSSFACNHHLGGKGLQLNSRNLPESIRKWESIFCQNGFIYFIPLDLLGVRLLGC